MKKLTALLAVILLASPLASAAGITINNTDGAGEGFNDPTVTTSPITGFASTLGADRLACFDAAAVVWEAILNISVEILIDAKFDPLGGTGPGGTPLGAAGPEISVRDFPGAPLSGTFYSVAQANQLRGVDNDPGFDDIGATFNSDVDTGAVPTFSWYYGIDGLPPGGTIDFFSTVMHEIGHGLGFLSLVNLTTGAKAAGGFNDIYSLQLQHGGSGGDTAFMSLSNAGRVTAFTSVTELEWIGAAVVADTTFGGSGSPVRMYAPSPVEGGSTLSHWDTSNSPDLLMEPFATLPFIALTLETAAFTDMAWPLLLGPQVDSQSGGGILFAGNNETFSATLSNTSGGETFSWELGGSPVSDGATGNGSTVSGATTTSMTITNIQSGDTGTYELFFTDGGSPTSLTTFSATVIDAVPVSNWIGLGLVGLLFIAGGVVTLRRQRA